MSVNDLVLVQGMHDTKLALRRWNVNPIAVIRPWAVLSTLIAVGLLLTVYVVAKLTPADATIYQIPGVTRDATLTDYGHVLFRNSLVLSLHALACVAGFMAGSSLPLSAAQRSGFSKWVHEKAGPLAIGFVVCATLFSLGTQAFIIGGTAASLATQLGTSPGTAAARAHAACGAGADRVVPSAGGLDDRQPARRLARASGRHVRDGGHRRARAARRRGGRDLGLAAAAAQHRLLNANGAARRPPRWLLPR